MNTIKEFFAAIVGIGLGVIVLVLSPILIIIIILGSKDSKYSKHKYYG